MREDWRSPRPDGMTGGLGGRDSVLDCGDGVFGVAALGRGGCVGVSFGILNVAVAKAVTSRTPSPQSKTWRQMIDSWSASWRAVFKGPSFEFIRSRRSGLDRCAFSGEINLGERWRFPHPHFTVLSGGVNSMSVLGKNDAVHPGSMAVERP